MKVICHKDLYNPTVVYGLLKNYQYLEGKEWFDGLKFMKFNYQGVANSLESYGMATGWFLSSFSKFKNSPFTKVNWRDFLPEVERILGDGDKQKAKEVLMYSFAKIVTTQETYMKEVFFAFYQKGPKYLEFGYEIIPKEYNEFIFYVEKRSDDGFIPKVHLEKLQNPEENAYIKKIPSTSIEISLQKKEYLEEMINIRLEETESDEEIALLLRLAEEIGLSVEIS